ncbi:hypothetical protein G9A89_017170 [Geosiphon pyriformis]|nr:hypothetical protein G9A89_017170 [Geosiphon pyriformis]
MAMMKNGRWQLNSIAAHVLLNGLNDQKEKRNGTINHVWLYTILLSDWVKKKTPIEAVWKRAVKCLDGYLNPNIILKPMDPKQFHKYYQELYCNKCDLIYNPLLCMIYMIPEEEEPIGSCTSKLESIFNPNSNFNNNNDENNDSSSTQYNNKDNNDSDSDLNSKQYIVLLDLTKEQKLK